MSTRGLWLATVGAVAAVSLGTALWTNGSPLPTEASVVAVDAERSARARWHEAEQRYGADSPEAGVALMGVEGVLQGSHAQRLVEGLQLSRRAVAILESAYGRESLEVVPALEGLAMWLWYAGDFEGERPVVERALAVRERAADEVGIARDLHLLSELCRVEGDYGRALQLRERALPIVEHAIGPDSEQMAVHLHYLAVVQKLIGDQNAALASALRAVAIREKVLSPTDPKLARSLNFLGGLLVDAGELSRAEPLLDRARAIWEKTGSPDGIDTALALTNLGKLFAARHEDERAAAVFENVARIRSAALGPGHPLVADTLTQLGAAKRRLGDRAAARSSLRRALEISEKRGLPSFPERAATLLEQALLDRDEGHLDVALREALEAEQLTRDHFRMSSLGLSEREALSKARSRVGGLDLAWENATDLESRGSLGASAASAILDESIHSRSLVLDTLATRQRILALHQDDEITAQVETLGRTQRRLTHLLMDESASPSAADLPGGLKEAQAEADRAERALAEKSREYRVERERGKPGLEEVRSALPPRSALVSYVRYGAANAAYVACIVAPGTDPPRIVPLGPAAPIDLAVRAWADGVSRDPRPRGAAASEADYLRVAGRLAEKIWDPVSPLLDGAERVFVVPDGELQGVNFATLVTNRGQYLVESGVSFQYLTTERDLVGSATSAARGRGLLALGDPAYGVTTDSGARRFDALPGSRREALEVASMWSARQPTKLLTGDEANETAFKRLAPSFRVLHVATHAFFQSGALPGESPLRVAGLAMAGANRNPTPESSPDEDDGILTAEEIAVLDLRGVEWAVLSACATGQGVLEPGEGILGLRRAFQIAGASTLIVSLWPVEDDATRYWMRTLYTAREAGATTVDAVRAASRGVLEEARRTGGTTHPYFWGGFVSIGDWR